MSHEMYRTNEIIGPQLLKAAEEKASELNTKYSPNLSHFIDDDVYGHHAVQNDLKKVLQREQSFKNSETVRTREQKRIASVFETFFVDAANELDWFGPDTDIMKTTKFDDYENGVDVIATFTDDDRPDHLALSTDLTFGTGASANKLEGIMQDIERNKMATLRYFHSDAMGYTGRLKGIPKTVIGLDKENVPEFIRLWLHEPENPEIETYRNILLTQLHDQLKFFTELAGKHHGESQIQRKYARAHKIVGSFWKAQNIDRSLLPTDTITEHVRNLR